MSKLPGDHRPAREEGRCCTSTPDSHHHPMWLERRKKLGFGDVNSLPKVCALSTKSQLLTDRMLRKGVNYQQQKLKSTTLYPFSFGQREAHQY